MRLRYAGMHAMVLHRTITDLQHARALKRRRDGDRPEVEPAVQTRSLTVYDALIAATVRHAGARLLTRDRRAANTYERFGVEYELLA